MSWWLEATTLMVIAYEFFGKELHERLVRDLILELVLKCLKSTCNNNGNRDHNSFSVWSIVLLALSVALTNIIDLNPTFQVTWLYFIPNAVHLKMVHNVSNKHFCVSK